MATYGYIQFHEWVTHKFAENAAASGAAVHRTVSEIVTQKIGLQHNLPWVVQTV
jgi:hypothetical protein